MSNLILPRRQIWTSQPQGPVSVSQNFGAPCAAAIHTSILAPDLVSGRNPALYGNISIPVATLDPSGKGFKASASANAIVPAYEIPEISGDYTLICLASIPSTGTWSLIDSDSYPGVRHLQFRIESTGKVGGIPFNTSASPFFAYSDDSVLVNSPFVAALRLSGNDADVWFAGKGGTKVTISGTPQHTHGAFTIGAGQHGSADDCLGGGATIYSWVAFPSAISDGALRELTKSASAYWQIFKRPDSRIFVPVSAGGGTTTVTRDSTASYKLQGSVLASAAAAYGIRSAIQADSAASYAISSSVQQSIAPSYSIRAAIQQDTTPSYSIRGTVDQVIAASYAIRSAISNDVVAAYSILSATAVSSSISAGYNIRGSINQDIAASYPLRGSVTQDTSATYSILSASTVSSSVTAGYAIKGSVQSSIVAGYSVAQAVQAEIAANYIIRSGVISETQAAYTIRGLVQQSIAATYAIEGIGGGFSGSLSDTDVARIASAVLAIIQANPLVVYGNWPTAIQNANAVMNQINNITQDVNVVSINGQIVVGDGTRALPWRPA